MVEGQHSAWFQVFHIVLPSAGTSCSRTSPGNTVDGHLPASPCVEASVRECNCNLQAPRTSSWTIFKEQAPGSSSDAFAICFRRGRHPNLLSGRARGVILSTDSLRSGHGCLERAFHWPCKDPAFDTTHSRHSGLPKKIHILIGWTATSRRVETLCQLLSRLQLGGRRSPRKRTYTTQWRLVDPAIGTAPWRSPAVSNSIDHISAG